MGGPGGHCAERGKSHGGGQMPCDSTYVWHLRNKINGRTKQEQTHRRRERFDGCQMGGESGGGANREGTEKSKLVVTKQSWDVKYIIKNSRR